MYAKISLLFKTVPYFFRFLKKGEDNLAPLDFLELMVQLIIFIDLDMI